MKRKRKQKWFIQFKITRFRFLRACPALLWEISTSIRKWKEFRRCRCLKCLGNKWEDISLVLLRVVNTCKCSQKLLCNHLFVFVFFSLFRPAFFPFSPLSSSSFFLPSFSFRTAYAGTEENANSSTKKNKKKKKKKTKKWARKISLKLHC